MDSSLEQFYHYATYYNTVDVDNMQYMITGYYNNNRLTTNPNIYRFNLTKIPKKYLNNSYQQFHDIMAGYHDCMLEDY